MGEHHPDRGVEGGSRGHYEQTRNKHMRDPLQGRTRSASTTSTLSFHDILFGLLQEPHHRGDDEAPLQARPSRRT